MRTLFCAPRDVDITTLESIEIMRAYVEQHPNMADSPAADAMLVALRHSFPCKR